MKIYLNGKIEDKEKIDEIFEPGFLFGWGVFEVLRVYKKKTFLLDKHIERLNKSLSLLGIDIPKIDYQNIIAGLLKANNLEDAYLRITAYKKRKETGVIIYVSEFSYYLKETYEKGFSVLIYPQKLYTKTLSFSLKSLSYLEKRLAWFYAQKNKKDESLILNQEGFLVGGSRTNLFLIKKNKIFTPCRDCGIFSGITRDFLIEVIRKELNFEVVEKKITLDDLKKAEEIFLSSSLVEVMPVGEIDGILKEKSNLTLKILNLYRSHLKNDK